MKVTGNGCGGEKKVVINFRSSTAEILLCLDKEKRNLKVYNREESSLCLNEGLKLYQALAEKIQDLDLEITTAGENSFTIPKGLITEAQRFFKISE